MTELKVPEVEPEELLEDYDPEPQYQAYDHVDCDYCGEKIERGATELHTGQIVHHHCEDGMKEQIKND